MMENTLRYWSAFAFFFGIGALVIIVKIRSYIISGFRFFLFSGLIIGVPFIILAIVFLFSKKAVQVLFLFMILISRAGLAWGEDQGDKAKEEEPKKWQKWISRQDPLSYFDQLFL